MGWRARGEEWDGGLGGRSGRRICLHTVQTCRYTWSLVYIMYAMRARKRRAAMVSSEAICNQEGTHSHSIYLYYRGVPQSCNFRSDLVICTNVLAGMASIALLLQDYGNTQLYT